MKRILYFHHGGGIGGAPLSLLFLLQRLDRAKYEPIVITLKDGPVVDLYRKEGIETHVEAGISDFSHTNLEWYGSREWWRLPSKLLSVFPSVAKTRKVIRKFKPDLVHFNSSTLALHTAAAKREGIPSVLHIREPLAHGYLGLRRGIIRRVIDQNVDRVIAISQYDADQLTPSDRLRVIYNFVDFDKFNLDLDGSTIRDELSLPHDAPVVLMLGGVAEPKGTVVLINAVPHLLQNIPNARVVIAGPGLQTEHSSGIKGIAKRILNADGYQREVQSALEKVGDQTVIFTGIRQDMPNLIAASNVLVFPSVVAHFARPIIEAAAMGKPSVASDLGGPRELVVDQQTGLLVKADDPQALASALSNLLSDPVKSKIMGEAAYNRARTLFEAGYNAAATITVYEELLVN